MADKKLGQEQKIETGNFRKRRAKALKDTVKVMKDNRKQKLESEKKEQQRNAKG